MLPILEEDVGLDENLWPNKDLNLNLVVGFYREGLGLFVLNVHELDVFGKLDSAYALCLPLRPDV